MGICSSIPEYETINDIKDESRHQESPPSFINDLPLIRVMMMRSITFLR